jgi:curved DNA-binding protein CbpA
MLPQIANAYEVLSDSDKRKTYDQFGGRRPLLVSWSVRLLAHSPLSPARAGEEGLKGGGMGGGGGGMNFNFKAHDLFKEVNEPAHLLLRSPLGGWELDVGPP